MPSDWQQTDTYYIVAHFHYVLFGGAIFGIFAGLYYWFPKFTGRLMSDRLGKLHFWTWMVGFNLTFAPMHWLGLQGMVRRTWWYAPETGLEPWNLAVTVGAFIIAAGVLIFMYNWVVSRRRGDLAPMDPWDGRTVEWSTPNPTPEYNFANPPVVHSLDDWWHRKYSEDDEGRPVPRPDREEMIARHEEAERRPAHPVHLPNPSYFPILAAAGLPLIAYGVIYHHGIAGKVLMVLGVLTTIAALIGWGMEPLEEPHGGSEHGEPLALEAH